MKRYAKGGDIRYWSKEKIKLFEFMQKMGVPRKTDMLNIMRPGRIANTARIETFDFLERKNLSGLYMHLA